jgi:hypothetical protein
MTALRAFRPLAAAVGALLATGTAVLADGHGYRHGASTQVITVSCYRGPWDDVIWDRPNPEFIDSLVNVGYSFPEAHSIAERVCRDPAAVGQSGVLSATMTNILRTSPPGS